MVDAGGAPRWLSTPVVLVALSCLCTTLLLPDSAAAEASYNTEIRLPNEDPLRELAIYGNGYGQYVCTVRVFFQRVPTLEEYNSCDSTNLYGNSYSCPRRNWFNIDDFAIGERYYFISTSSVAGYTCEEGAKFIVRIEQDPDCSYGCCGENRDCVLHPLTNAPQCVQLDEYEFPNTPCDDADPETTAEMCTTAGLCQGQRTFSVFLDLGEAPMDEDLFLQEVAAEVERQDYVNFPVINTAIRVAPGMLSTQVDITVVDERYSDSELARLFSNHSFTVTDTEAEGGNRTIMFLPTQITTTTTTTTAAATVEPQATIAGLASKSFYIIIGCAGGVLLLVVVVVCLVMSKNNAPKADASQSRYGQQQFPDSAPPSRQGTGLPTTEYYESPAPHPASQQRSQPVLNIHNPTFDAHQQQSQQGVLANGAPVYDNVEAYPNGDSTTDYMDAEVGQKHMNDMNNNWVSEA